MAPAVATYQPRHPRCTVLYHVIAEHLETFLASLADDPEATGLPAYVQREFYDYLPCGILAHGFLRLGCDTCHHELLVPFSCKRRGFCPSCAGRRMAQTAAYLVEQVIPWVPTRQWVVSVPIPLRYWTASSQDLTAKVHTIIRRTIAQYYVNHAVTRGVSRDKVSAGSVTGRCFKGVDPVLESYPKLIAIDEEANHEIVHRRRFGKTNGTPYEPLDPSPQVDVFALDFLRVLLAHMMLLWVDVPLIRAPPIGVKAGNTKRFQQGL